MVRCRSTQTSSDGAHEVIEENVDKEGMKSKVAELLVDVRSQGRVSFERRKKGKGGWLS